MKKHLFLPFAASLLIITGCTNEVKYPESPKEVQEYIANAFDYVGWVKCPIKLEMGRESYVELYNVDPVENPNAKPFYTVITEKDGTYDGSITVEGALIGQDVWATTSTANIKAKLSVDGTKFTNTQSRTINYSESRIKRMCKDFSDYYHDYLKAGVDNTSKLSKDNGMNITTLEETEVMFSLIDGGDQLAASIYYYYYPASYASVEEAFPAVDDGEGNITGGPAAFYEKFIDNKYCITKDFYIRSESEYVENESNVQKLDASQIAALSDVQKERLNFIDQEVNGKYQGYSVKLKYYDAEGVAHDKFPAGYTIGFMLVMADYNSIHHRSVLPPAQLNYDSYFYTRYAMLTDQNSGARKSASATKEEDSDKYYSKPSTSTDWSQHHNANRFVAAYQDLKASTVNNKYDHIIYGWEDNCNGGCDWDYDDIMFLITTEGKISTTLPKLQRGDLERTGTYCFEDLYPALGDFDLNDVMVKYTYTIKYAKNEGDAISVEYFSYEFEPYHDGADYINDFWLGFLSPYGMPEEALKCVYTNNKDQLGNTFFAEAYVVHGDDPNGNNDTEVGDDFCKNILYKDAATAFDYLNPFIYVQDTGYQVHLTKHSYSPGHPESIQCDENDEYAKNYLVNPKYGSHGSAPFALDIPTHNFIPVREGNYISIDYPFFLQWVGWNGEKMGEWYSIHYSSGIEGPGSF